MKKEESTRGLLSLEASISLIVFMFIMLYLYSLFVVFEARNEMAHVLLATADSMSLDAYENETLGGSDSISGVLYDAGAFSNLYKQLFGVSTPTGSAFSTSEMWTKMEKGAGGSYWDGTIYAAGTDVTGKVEEGYTTGLSGLFSKAIQERFNAYLAGDGSPDDVLEKYHIKDGTAGLDFRGSYIKGGKLYLKVRYTIEYEYKLFGMGETTMEQSCCSKIWS